MQDAITRKLGLGLQSLLAFCVFIKSREYLVCNEVCRQVPLLIQGHTMLEDLFILHMEEANVLLGIHQIRSGSQQLQRIMDGI